MRMLVSKLVLQDNGSHSVGDTLIKNDLRQVLTQPLVKAWIGRLLALSGREHNIQR